MYDLDRAQTGRSCKKIDKIDRGYDEEKVGEETKNVEVYARETGEKGSTKKTVIVQCKFWIRVSTFHIEVGNAFPGRSCVQ